MTVGLVSYVAALFMVVCVVASAVAYALLRRRRRILLDAMVGSFIVGLIFFFVFMALTFD